MKFVKDNEKFLKKISNLFPNKIRSKEKITLVENEDIIWSDIEITETYFVKNSNIQISETHLFKTTQTQDDHVLACI